MEIIVKQIRLRRAPTRHIRYQNTENYVSINFEEVKSCIVNIESIFSRAVCNFIPCPTMCYQHLAHAVYNVNTQMHTL